MCAKGGRMRGRSAQYRPLYISNSVKACVIREEEKTTEETRLAGRKQVIGVSAGSAHVTDTPL